MQSVSMKLPQGWFASGSSPQSYDMGVVAQHVPQKICFIESTDSRIDGFGTLMQICSAHSFRGKKIRYSALLKPTQVHDWSGIWLRILGVDEKELKFDNMSERPVHGTSDWIECEIVLEVPDAADTMRFGVLLHGTGRLEFTKLTIEEIDGEQPETVSAHDDYLDDSAQNVEQIPLSEVPLNMALETQQGDMPDSWRPLICEPSNYRMGVEQSNNKNIGFIESSDESSVRGCFAQKLSSQFFRGRRMRLSGRARTSGATKGAGLFFRANAATPRLNTLCYDDMFDRALVGETDWVDAAVVLDIPEESATITLGVYLIGAGKVEFSDLRFAEVGDDCAVTNNYSRVAASKPRNLDFVL